MYLAGFLTTLFEIAFWISGVLMLILIMLRKGEGGGLAGAFGGIGGDAAFGVKAQKTLDKIVTVLAIVFLGTAMFIHMPVFKDKEVGSGASGKESSSENK